MNTIDWNILKELESKTNTQIIVKLINSFLNTAYQSKQANLDYKIARNFAHQIKSSAAIVGALELSNLALDVEKTISMDEVLWEQYFQELDKVIRELETRSIYL